MIGLEQHLLTRLRETLKMCDEFRSYGHLRTIFVTEELSPFICSVNEGASTAELVDKNIEYFLGLKNTNGIPVFPILLDTLCSRYPEQDQRHAELYDLSVQIRGSLENNLTKKTLNAREKNSITEIIPKINRKHQVRIFRQAIRDFKTVSFLIHGPPEHGQLVLTKYLSEYYPKWKTGQLIKVDAGSNGTGKSVRSLWRNLAKSLGLSFDATKETIIEQVSFWLDSLDVILWFDSIESIPVNILKEWIQEFWFPLSKKVKFVPKDNHLILLLVDYAGTVINSGLQFSNDLEQFRTTNAPIVLHPTGRFSKEDFENWLDEVSGIVESNFSIEQVLDSTENGIPDLVFEKICELHGFSWQGEC